VATIAHSPIAGRINSATPKATATARPEPIISTADRPSNAMYASSAAHMNAIVSWMRTLRPGVPVPVIAG